MARWRGPEHVRLCMSGGVLDAVSFHKFDLACPFTYHDIVTPASQASEALREHL